MRKYLLVFLLFLLGLVFGKQAQAAGVNYYLDCNGSDGNNGTSQASAWGTLNKVNSFNFQAGDHLLMRKGCSWNGTLTLSESGTASDNIFIEAYGSGELPLIENGSSGSTSVDISGSYITLDSIFTRAIAPSTESGCQNQPKGHIVGVTFESGATNNTLKNSKLTGAYAGVYLKTGSHHNRILSNNLFQNTMMNPLDTASNNDAGAFGVLVWGDDNEIANNNFSGQDACSYDYVRDGSAVEIYGGQRNNIHHNKTTDSDSFTELGNSRSQDNIYAYNLFYSSLERSIFMVTRGANDGYGPVTGTQAYNNTVYLTGSTSQGFVCYAGCSSNILKLRNNIFYAAGKAGYADNAFDNAYNIYYQGQRQFTLGPNDLVVDPQFVNPSGGDFQLKPGSPAIDSGSSETTTYGYTNDLEQKIIPIGSALDRGAFEFGTSTTSPIPSVSGDANGDGKVDGLDYVIWLNHYNTQTANNGADGDFNVDQKVDGIDYIIWLNNYGVSTIPSPIPTATATASPTASPTATPTASPTASPTSSPTAGDHVVVSIGDISRTTGSPSKDVADYIKNVVKPDAIIMVGDYDQGTGTLTDILAYPDKLYGPKPGGLYPIMYPTAGPTHDVASCSDQLGYYSYWGKDAFKGYSFDIGAWHFISLPSAATRYGCDVVGVTNWLQADLVAHPNKCIFAFWHEPYFTRPTESHPALTATRAWVDALLLAHADILTSGHQNGDFEAFNPQNASYVADPNGIQAFVSATGGQSPYAFTGTAPNLISSSSGAYGPLVFNLNDNGTYTWQFIKVTGSVAAPSPASGSGVCR